MPLRVKVDNVLFLVPPLAKAGVLLFARIINKVSKICQKQA
jgi:hypothetical protein